MLSTYSQRALQSPLAQFPLNALSSIAAYLLNILYALFAPILRSGPVMGVSAHIYALVTFLSSNYKPRPKHLVFVTIAMLLILMLIAKGAMEISHSAQQRQEAFSTLRKILLSGGGELAGRARVIKAYHAATIKLRISTSRVNF
ncbi:hypothetical protein PVAG01_10150 [Phlyctema vagabunda]|uniref:Uncharacterized protein n=1 Tax=Phlyctema vagabunda TaxID=108571 RepID=A0ABR4P547_9HELO